MFENRGWALIATSVVWVGLLTLNAVTNDLTNWGIVATVVAGVLGVGTLFFVIVCENIVIPARTGAAIIMAALTLLTGFDVFGSVYETRSTNSTNEQRMADQANAELYSTGNVTIIPDEAGHILFTKDSCLPTGELPPGISLWNGKTLENGMIENDKGFCELTLDSSVNYARLVPTRNGVNALRQLKYLPPSDDPSKVVARFPVDVRVDVYVYNPKLASQQGAELMPTWVSNNGTCNGCSAVGTVYASSN